MGQLDSNNSVNYGSVDFRFAPTIGAGNSRSRGFVKAVNIRDSMNTYDSWKIKGFEQSEDKIIDSHRSDNSYSSHTINKMQHRYDSH